MKPTLVEYMTFVKDFMIENNCLSEFKENLLQSYKKFPLDWKRNLLTLVQSEIQSKSSTSLLYLFNHAFHWEDTLQSFGYWCGLNDAFKRKCHQWIKK